MEIKMKTLSAGPSGVRNPGSIHNIDAKEAKDLIAGGYAEATRVIPPLVDKVAAEKAAAEKEETEKAAAEKAAAEKVKQAGQNQAAASGKA